MSDPLTAEVPAGRVWTAAAYALVLVLTVLLAVWGSFLVPLRVWGMAVPVSWAVAVVGNLALGRAAGRLAGRGGAAVPGLLWLAVAFTLGSKRAEGDVIVPGNTVGLGFLLGGAAASAMAYGLARGAAASRRRSGST